MTDLPAAPDAAYTACIAAIAAETRALQKSTLDFYWLIGQIVSGFIDAAGEAHSRKNLELLARDLENKRLGVSFGITTLYCARSIFKTYARAALDDMVVHGVMIGHLKALAQIEDGDARESLVAEHLYAGPDGQAIPVKELETLVQQSRQQQAKKGAHDAIEKAKTVEYTEVTDSSSQPDGLPVDATGDQPASAGTGETASSAVAAVGMGVPAGASQTGGSPREFTQSPLKVLKALESTATKLLIQAGDAVIAVTEVSKIGFDSERAQANYNLVFANARTAVADVQEVLKALLDTMTEAEP
jgi:hypothetical protein